MGVRKVGVGQLSVGQVVVDQVAWIRSTTQIQLKYTVKKSIQHRIPSNLLVFSDVKYLSTEYATNHSD